MKSAAPHTLGGRERQIMEIVYRRGRATAAEVLSDLPDPPTYSTIRGMLRYLESKGHLRHEQDGARYVYLPTSAKSKVRVSALADVVRTFYDGSVGAAVATLLTSGSVSREEYERLSRLLDEAARKDDP